MNTTMIPSHMTALRKTTSGAGFELCRISVPTPTADEVLLRVLACSLCGTDIHVYNHDEPFASRVIPPVTTGHEVCGEVVLVGSAVTSLSIGDRVSAESHIPCRQQPRRVGQPLCHMCTSGNEHICVYVQFFSVDVDGFMAEYAVAPAALLWKHASPAPHPRLASLMESLGNSVYTVAESHVRDAVVAVFGLGPTGLNAIKAAIALGAKSVIGVGGTALHRQLASKMGAAHVINRHTDDVLAEVRRLTSGRGVDVALEMSGSAEALEQCLHCVKPTGRVSILALYSAPMQLDVSKLVVLKDLTVRGIYGRKLWSTWELTDKLIRNGMDISPVVTHEFDGLTHFMDGVNAMKNGECGKVVFYPNGRGESASAIASNGV